MSDISALLSGLTQLQGQLALLQTKAEEAGQEEQTQALKQRKQKVRELLETLLQQAFEEWTAEGKIREQLARARESVEAVIDSLETPKQFARQCVDAVGKIDDVVNAIVRAAGLL